MNDIIEKLRGLDLELLEDEINCRIITAIYTIKASDQLSQKLKDYRMKLVKWGKENDSKDKIDRIRANNPLIIYARSIIVQEEPKYPTDDEYEMACLETGKQEETPVAQQDKKSRGKGKQTIQKIEEQKDLESLYGSTPAPEAQRPVPKNLARPDRPAQQCVAPPPRRPASKNSLPQDSIPSSSSEKPKPEPKAKTKSKPEPKAKTKSGPEPKDQTNLKPEPKAKTKSGPEPKAQTNLKPQPKAKKAGRKRPKAFEDEVDKQWRIDPSKKMKLI